MKLSSETINLLQSFAQISANLLVKPGNKISIRNAQNSIQARATVKESFDTPFAVYDLNQLLSLISVAQDPDIEFGEKSMAIRSASGSEVEYFYADASLIPTPAETLPNLEDVYTFNVSASDIGEITKTASIVSATMMNVVSNNGKVTLSVNDPKNSTSHSMKRVLGDCTESFNVKMAIDSFKVVPDSYRVRVTRVVAKNGNKAGVFVFESTTRDVIYLIAADQTSKV